MGGTGREMVGGGRRYGRSHGLALVVVAFGIGNDFSIFDVIVFGNAGAVVTVFVCGDVVAVVAVVVVVDVGIVFLNEKNSLGFVATSDGDDVSR